MFFEKYFSKNIFSKNIYRNTFLQNIRLSVPWVTKKLPTDWGAAYITSAQDNMAVCRLLLSIKFNREVTPQKNCRQRRQTSNVRLPLELRSDRRETSATRVSDDLQLSIFRRRKKKKIGKNFGSKNQKKNSEFVSNFFFSASKNRNLQIVWNARCRSFVAIGAKFEG